MVWLFPLGLCLAFGAALLQPAPGIWLNQLGLLPWLVALIFLMNGLQTSLQQLRPEPCFGRTLLSGALISLLLSPLLGWLVYAFGGLDDSLRLGLLVMSMVPPTLSSCVVLTRITGGKASWSLFMTLGLNFIGIATIPFMLSLLVGDSMQLSPWPMLLTLLKIVLLPFIGGMLLRLWLPALGRLPWLGQVSTLSVIVTSWITLSASGQALYQLSAGALLELSVWSVLLHVALLLLCVLGGRLLRLALAERRALMFTASQKTMPVAVSVLVGLGSNSGAAVVSCILFHFLQMLFDSLLASRIQRRQKRSAAIEEAA
ncbi:bile acid:sodium symporter [Oceanisphaera arctica]|uniref:Bile acid:sodium symporter n=1 Tax=Oceanisphaera arctica TaxID=641510 RepID=A0A2P5THV4_9GAMM|nr:bile acid:sodium symporter [Oceanisphaera arctica]PPL14115.1 bile acid:sodium symporter [Oceanisphaera arctica]